MTIISNLPRVCAKKPADAKEWSLCAYMGVERFHHDSGSYDKDSDCNSGDMHISIKSSGFTLMSGSLCEGRKSFDEIWALYESRVHSNWFAYITEDYVCYMMNLSEFKRFVYAFGRTERESEKNGGQMKIRCRKESSKMLKWLADRAAA